MELVREAEAGELDLEDPQLEEKLVNELKAQGVFDQFRKDCLSDVDTKPAYQNLRVRVDKSVSSYLSKTTWRPTLNKNQLRNQLRKYIQEMSGVEAGVDRIVDQIVNPKLNTTFMPEVENVIYKYFGTSKPEEGEDIVNGNNVDEDSQNLQNGDSHNDVGGKISTRNLSTISSDAEMLNFDANSVGSSPGPGLAGNVSPLTPGCSPKVNQGDISPLTPSTTPPLPASNTQQENMELSQSNEGPMQMETPPPPPPGEELKIEEIVTMEVDTEETSRPQSAYTPPLPPANNTRHSTPEKSYTPPLPMMLPPHPPTHQPERPSSPHTPPLPPLPRDGRDDSGGEASMSSISDTDLGDISPPRQRKQEYAEGDKKDGDTASDISEEELRPDNLVLEGSVERDSDNNTPDKDSDEDLQQLEKMKAELMAQLEGDFKLSPEESDSDGEEDVGGTVKDSPTSPDHSASSRSETPALKQPSPSSTNSSPTNQLQRVRNLPLPTPDYSTMTPAQRIKALPLPGEEVYEEAKSQSVSEELIQGPMSPPGPLTGPRTPPGPMGRSPSLSPSPPPTKRGPQTPPSPPSAFSSRPPLPPSSPPQDGLSKLDLNDPQTVTPMCKPNPIERPRSPGPDGDMGGSGGSSAPSHAVPLVGTSSSQEGNNSTTTSTGSSDQRTPVTKSSHHSSSSRSHHKSSKHHSSSKDRRSEKKLDKIKEQTKAKIEKYEQKIKSKDTIKSDKFQALDIFSTTKKPATPHQPHRVPKTGNSGSNTPSTPKPQKDFEKKLAESIRKEVERREEEKERRRKEEEKNKSFKMPVKIDDRRRSSSDDKIKERRGSKDDKKDSSKSKDKERSSHERDRKERKSSSSSSSSKERRTSEDEKKVSIIKDSKYDKEREKQAQESKKRLQDAREKKEREEKEKKRQKEKEKREEKKIKDEKEKVEKKDKLIDKIKDKSKSEIKDVIKEKIGSLGIDNIQKMLMESLAEKTGAKFSEDEKKDMIKKLEGLIQKKKVAKESPKKYVDPETSEDEKPVKKVSPAKKNKIIDSSDSSSSDSDFDSDSEGDQKIREIKNRIRERRKSGESEKSGGQSPKRTRPVRNKSFKTVKMESEHSDTDGDFVIREEILEKAPQAPKVSVEAPVKVENKNVKDDSKVEAQVKAQPIKKPVSKSSKVKPAPKKADIDPEMEDLSAFSQSDVDFMLSIKDKYDSLLKDEDLLSVSSVTSEELNAAIPSSKTVVIDAGPNPEETVRIMKQFGGNPRLFTPVPEWLHPYLLGAKVRVEDVGMPTKQEISDYIQNKQTKSKKRGSGWDIVVEWVPTGPPMAKKSKLEKQLGFDLDSSFGQTVAQSGGKRTRRANMKYSDKISGEEDPAIKQGLEINPSLANFGSSAVDQPNYELDLPNPAPNQAFNTVRTHQGSAQTPKRGGKGRKDSLVVKRAEPSVPKDEVMEVDASEELSDKAKDSPDSPPAAEDRAEVISPVGDASNPVIADDSSPGKKRRSKDIIAAYLTSAGVERADQAVTVGKIDMVGDTKDSKSVTMEVGENAVDTSSNSIIAVVEDGGDKEAVVAMLDAEISAADEELNSVLKNLKRKRSCSGDSKFHGWAVQPIAVPRTALSTMLESAGAELAQLETTGARLGMSDIDCLLSLEEAAAGESLLEVVMSPPVQGDIKKVENMALPSVAGVKPIESVEAGTKGKLSDSDSDERGALSPSSFGSAKENVPEIYNSAPSKFNQKKRILKNPVLKTSLKMS